MSSRYTALLVDIKRSRARSVDSREQLQLDVELTLRYLNKMFGPGIAKPVVFSAGDEVQGLFYSSLYAFLYYRALVLVMGSGTFHGGMGFGSWDTVLKDAPSTAQDGTAYHHARAALACAKRSREYQLIIKGFEDCIDDRATTLFGYPLSIIESRTSEQSCIALWAELLRPVAIPSDVINDDHDIRALSEELFYLSLRRRRAQSKRASNSTALFDQGWSNRFKAFSSTNREYTSLDRLLSPRRDRDARGLGSLAIVLAPIAGKSRQSVDKSIVRSRLAQERDATALVAEYLIDIES